MTSSSWFLRWLTDPDSGLDETEQREWERKNVFLIPAATKKSRAQSPRCVSQQHPGRMPSHRPAIRPQPGGLHGNYGRFGKSCPPGLEAPIERRDEEEAEQEEGSGRGLKRSHSTTTTASLPKRRSMDRAHFRSTCSDESGERRPPAAHTCLKHGRSVSACLDIPPSNGSRSALQQLVASHQQQLSMQRWQPADNPFPRAKDSFEEAIQLDGSPEGLFTLEASNPESDSSMGPGALRNLQPPACSNQRRPEGVPRESSAHSVTLDELLDETVQDLSKLSVKRRSAPVLTSGRCATVDALNESLSNACLHAMLVVEQPTSDSESCCSAQQIRRDSAPAMRRAFSSASRALASIPPGTRP